MSGGGSGKSTMKLKLNTSQANASSPPPSAATAPTPTLKLNLSRRQSEVAPIAQSASQATPPLEKGPDWGPQLSLASVPPGKTPASKKRKESGDKASVSSSKKPKLNLAHLSHSGPPGQAKLGGRKPSIVKLGKGLGSAGTQSPTTPGGSQVRALRVKHKGNPAPRPLGVGYDSEAEDAEEDPAIEENIILRMLPGPDAEYVRNAIEERKIGLPLGQGGADISIRFFTRDARRAAVRVRDQHYAAVLVDLPCIVETMKSWDRKGWWKSADICQMLLVTQVIPDEDAARTAPLPREVDTQTWKWPHGLTPPMHNVRKRRFRKRVDHKTIEQAELEVERLLELDEQAKTHEGTSYHEILDLDQLRREEEGPGDDQGDGQEVDENMDVAIDDEDDADWQAQFVAQLGADDDEENEQPDSAAPTPAEGAEVVEDSQVPPSVAEAETPSADTQQSQGEDSEALAETPADTPAATPGTLGTTTEDDDDDDDDDDEDEDEDDADGDGEEEIDEEEREKQQYQAQQREEIGHLDRQIAERREQLAKQSNPLLKSKLVSTIKKLEEERVVKKRGLGDTDDDD